MKKEFDINDILEAIDNISEINEKNKKTLKKKDITNNNDILSLNDQTESDKSEMLVLDQMIE
jgi:hypothetical protein